MYRCSVLNSISTNSDPFDFNWTGTKMVLLMTTTHGGGKEDDFMPGVVVL